MYDEFIPINYDVTVTIDSLPIPDDLSPETTDTLLSVDFYCIQ